MKVIVTTWSGAKYTLDTEKLTWERESDKPLRWTDPDRKDQSGTMLYMPEVWIGESMAIPLPEPGRYVVTTPVVNFENVEG
jgi:hypothetical protein